MKNLLQCTALIVIASILTSCVNTKVVISGPVGTELYTVNDDYVGTIGYNGKFTKKFKYTQSLLKAKLPDSNMVVPFAIDFNYHSQELDLIMFSLGLCYTPWGWVAISNTFKYPEGATLVKEQTIISDFNFTQPKYNE